MNDFKTLREYNLPTQDIDPQPDWALYDNRIVVRSKRGLGLLDEGRNKKKFFNLSDARRIGWPIWMDEQSIMLSSPTFMIVPEKTDPTLQHASSTHAPNEAERATESHISMSIVIARGFKLEEDLIYEGVSSYKPQRMSNKIVMAQKGESVVIINHKGAIEIYDQGFFPQLQTDGKGVAFQTVPVTENDYWTGKKDNGSLIIRWKKHHVSIFPGLIQARWCHDGGVIATRLHAVPQTPSAWRSVDSDIVYIAPGSDQATVVLAHARSPAPHPDASVAAVIVRNEGLFLVDYTNNSSKFLVEDGDNPQWNFDGSRLLTEVDAQDGKNKDLRIWVFQTGKQ